MKIVKKMPIATDWDLLKEAIRNGQLSTGDEIELDDGSRWRVLDVQARRVLIWKYSGNGVCHIFNENTSNTYEGSDIQKYLKGDFKKTAPQELVEMADDDFFLLSKEELERYMPRTVDRITTNEYGVTMWWWTRSESRDRAGGVWVTEPGGCLNMNYAACMLWVAPAVYISA